MNRLLTTISDIREFRQLGKQVNDDNFTARVREVQDNELTELLGRSLAYDFFNSLETNWTTQAGTFTRDSDYQFTAVAADLSAWTNYAIKINNEVFVIVKSAIFGGADTVIIVEGYVLPTTLTTIEYKVDNKYIKLLNGSSYTNDSETIQYNGLRPFISWKFLAIFLTDANVKHSDTGNFSITSPNFERPSGGSINAAKQTYLSNSTREENSITEYLNTNDSDFPLWDSKPEQNSQNFNFVVI
jgi:hypothetical protein